MESINIGVARRIRELIIIYLLIGVYALAVSWYYDHSIVYGGDRLFRMARLSDQGTIHRWAVAWDVEDYL